MPRYYCDYCDTYLTHDSPSVRKQHNAGYKHKANIRAYYQKFEEQQTQILIDQKIKQHLGQTAAYQQIGAAYIQHISAFPGVGPRLPVMPPPFSLSGAAPPQLAPGVRTPVMQISVPGAPGYPTTSLLVPGQAPSPQTSVLQAPPSTSSLSPAPRDGPPLKYSGNLPSTAVENINLNNTPGVASAPAGNYPFPQVSQTSI